MQLAVGVGSSMDQFPSQDGGVQLVGAMYATGDTLSFHTANRAYPIPEATNITLIEPRTDDPVDPVVGRCWLRVDIA